MNSGKHLRYSATDIKGAQQPIHCDTVGSDQLREPTFCNASHQFELAKAKMRVQDAQCNCESRSVLASMKGT